LRLRRSCWTRWLLNLLVLGFARRFGRGRWSGYAVSGPRSRGSVYALPHKFVNSVLAPPLCGNREWGLRPHARTTYPTATVGIPRQFMSVACRPFLKVDGGIPDRSPHSRLPQSRQANSSLNEPQRYNKPSPPASVGRRAGIPPSAYARCRQASSPTPIPKKTKSQSSSAAAIPGNSTSVNPNCAKSRTRMGYNLPHKWSHSCCTTRA